MMGYLKKISSLEDSALSQVAVNLCQDTGFKEVALRLEKPTYGAFMDENSSSLFLTDPHTISILTELNESKREFDFAKRLLIRNYLRHTGLIKQWNAAVDEQCEKLTEGIPCILKQRVHAWMSRIALEYLSYSRRQEVLFGVSRYFMMNFLSQEDWTRVGRLDEKKIAERLIKEEQFTVFQRYRIACVYCLHQNIPQLWKELTQEEKQSITRYDDPEDSEEGHNLILLWSYWLDGHREENLVRRRNFWIYAAQQAVYDGNRAALMSCWKKWDERLSKQCVINLALQSLQTWQRIQYDLRNEESWAERLILRDASEFIGSMEFFNVPCYYSELMCFFLSQMDEEQQWTFFKEAFWRYDCNSVLKCFLDWPHQDDCLPTINRLWEIIPKDKYADCLLTLASKYSGKVQFSSASLDEKENRYYDYRKLLRTLWEETPDEYKQYVFLNKNNQNNSLSTNKGKLLLPLLLERSPFQDDDETLFIRIFFYQPLEERRAMIHSIMGEKMCLNLMKKEKWSFLNWLLEECLSKEEIPSFKKQFIQSNWGHSLFCSKLIENRERFVEDLMDWAFEFSTEKAQFKTALITSRACLSACKSQLFKGEIAKMEHIINFCAALHETTDSVKMDFARNTCKDLLRAWACSGSVYDCSDLLEVLGSSSLLKDKPWEHMDTILAWSTDAEENIGYLKKDIFSDIRIDIHHELVFHKKWKDAEHFYNWFGLSSEDIKQLKRDTLFTPMAIDLISMDLSTPEFIEDDIDMELSDPEYLMVTLRWCLTDEETVIDLKKEIEEQYYKEAGCEMKKQEKEKLNDLVDALLHSLRSTFEDNTSKEVVLRKEKRSAVIEDEFSSPIKGGREDIQEEDL